jgi:hypothetical protein
MLQRNLTTLVRMLARTPKFALSTKTT